MLSLARSGLSLRRINSHRLCRLGRLACVSLEFPFGAADDMRSDTRPFADRVPLLVLETEETGDGRAARMAPFCGRERRELGVDGVEGGVEEVRDRSRRRLAQVVEEVLRECLPPARQLTPRLRRQVEVERTS